MNSRRATSRLIALFILISAAQGLGCLPPSGGDPLNDVLALVDVAKPALPAPVVETLVAEPRASVDGDGSTPIAQARTQARTGFELSIPRGHLLMIGLIGQARWAEDAEGRIGFYLAVQHWLDESWQTIGSDGVSGDRVGPAVARGRAAVPVRFDAPGLHRVRALVWTISEPHWPVEPPADGNAEDFDVVTIDVTVLAGPEPEPGTVDPPVPAPGPEWLEPDPPELASLWP